MNQISRNADDRASNRAPLSIASATPLQSNGAGASATHPMNILLVSTLFMLPYRVLRCLQATGASIYVLGSQRAKGLSYSKYCKEFVHSTRSIDGSFDAELADEINQYIERFAIDIVLPGDAPSTRSLIAIKDLINSACFPMPKLDKFDLLNDKWQFTNLCGSLGIKCPRTRLFLSTAELRKELDAGTLEFPLIAKPLSMDNSSGIVILRSGEAPDLSSIFYSPILVQQFIEGEDIGASIYCEHGKIRSFVVHKYHRAVYSAWFDSKIYEDLGKIARATNVDGVFNFDMRVTPDGDVFYLECNPRFYFKIAMSMLAGINFVQLGLPNCGTSVPRKLTSRATVQFPKAMLASLPMPWKLKKNSWEVIQFLLDDPIPYFREEFGLEKNN